MDKIGVYLHVPFCRTKCPYCDFYSVPFTEQLADEYTRAVIRVLGTHPFGRVKANTLYLGGGTPTLLGLRRLTEILERAATTFGLDCGSEITIEGNPESLPPILLSGLRQAGYNRLSVGVQSLVDTELKALGRGHSSRQGQTAILNARAAGFEDISADIMLATPGQSIESLTQTIRMLTRLPVNHLSAYLLKLEPDSQLARQNIPLPDDDLAAGLYLECLEQLSKEGFEQYEVSNFARAGKQSRHNLKYWQRREYLGIGPAAHSFLGGERFAFPPKLDDFLRGNPFAKIEYQPPDSAHEEEIMLRIRLTQGLDTKDLARQHKINPAPLLLKAENLAGHGFCRVEDGVISLTAEGFLISNTITAELIGALVD